MFDESNLAQAFGNLPTGHKVAFAAACCERLLPNYEAFTMMEGWGNPALLKQTLRDIWSFLPELLVDEAFIRERINSCEAIIPDTEDFTSLFTGGALNAAAAILYTLECCLDGDSKWPTLVGRLAMESIEEYLNIVTDPEIGYHTSSETFDHWVQQAPLLAAEREHQQRDLQALKSRSVLDMDVLRELRERSSTSGIQPLARGMVKVANRQTGGKDED